MSKAVKEFFEYLVKSGQGMKIFSVQTPWMRIAPPRVRDNDKKHQLRIDAGETIGHEKHINLQINQEATNGALKARLKKFGSHDKLATVTVDMRTPPEKRQEVLNEKMASLCSQAIATV